MTLNVSPLLPNAPKLCPAEPWNSIWIVLFGKPFEPYFFDISLDNIVPTALSVLLILEEKLNFLQDPSNIFSIFSKIIKSTWSDKKSFCLEEL